MSAYHENPYGYQPASRTSQNIQFPQQSSETLSMEKQPFSNETPYNFVFPQAGYIENQRLPGLTTTYPASLLPDQHQSDYSMGGDHTYDTSHRAYEPDSGFNGSFRPQIDHAPLPNIQPNWVIPDERNTFEREMRRPETDFYIGKAGEFTSPPGHQYTSSNLTTLNTMTGDKTQPAGRPAPQTIATREVAKAAIREMHAKGIDLDQLVRGEDNDLASLVRLLWTEAGLSIPSQMDLSSDPTGYPHDESEQPALTNTAGLVPQSSQYSYRDQEVDAYESSQGPLQRLGEVSPQIDQSLPLKIFETQTSHPKETGPQEERKDRIARLIAQKASKSNVKAPGSSLEIHKPEGIIAKNTISLPPTTNEKPQAQHAKPQLSSSSTAPPTSMNFPARGKEATKLALKKIEEQKRKQAKQSRMNNVVHIKQPQYAEDGDEDFYEPTLAESEPNSLTYPAAVAQGFPPMIGATEISQGELRHHSPAVIPGLFMMTKSSMQEQLVERAQEPSPVLSTRSRLKRPVASDFDEDTAASSSDSKRPFGSMRTHSQVIINLSDEESGSEAGEIVDQEKPNEDTSQAIQSFSSEMPQIFQKSIRDMPPLSDTINHNVLHQNGQSSKGPLTSDGGLIAPLTSAANALSKAEDAKRQSLREKEAEIRALHEKIARMQKAKQSKGQAQAAGSTVQPSEAATAPTITPLDPTVSKPVVREQTPVPVLRHASSAARMRESSSTPTMLALSRELEIKKKRKAQLESELLSMNAVMNEARSKAEELKLEMQRWEAIVKSHENDEKRRKLMTDLDELDIGEDSSTLQNSQTGEVSHATDVEEPETIYDPDNATRVTITESMDFGASEPQQPIANSGSTSRASSQSMDLRSDVAESDSSPLARQGVSVHSPSQRDDGSFEEGEVSDESGETNAGVVIADHIEEPMVKPNVNNSTREISSSQEEEGETPAQTHSNSVVDSQDPGNDASAESDSDFYEPPDADLQPIVADDNLSQVSDSSGYEPPPADLSAPITTNSGNIADKIEPVTSNELTKTTMETGLPGLQALPVPDSSIKPDVISAPESGVHFTPYDSPLKVLQTYRTHPNFLTEVGGGYRSLTYSNSIDATRPLCLNKVNGIACDYPQCEGQHFRDIIPSSSSDQLFLQSITSPNPGRNEQERQEYTEGLGKLLTQLSTSGNAFPAIAAALVKYRRDYVFEPFSLLIKGPSPLQTQSNVS